MKANTTISVRTESGIERREAYRPIGCYFVVNADENTFRISDPQNGYSIVHGISQFQVACKFANLIHDLLVKAGKLTEYSQAFDVSTKADILLAVGFRKYSHLRLCKSKQFDIALAEQNARNIQLLTENQVSN
jgi:hypothetical protein